MKKPSEVEIEDVRRTERRKMWLLWELFNAHNEEHMRAVYGALRGGR